MIFYSLLKASDRVSPAYVNGDDARGGVAGRLVWGHSAGHALDEEQVSNLCDVGAYGFCDGVRCACACHREVEE